MSAFNKKTVDDINAKGKRVLVRCDFNVPLKDGVITDDNRINGALPTIKKLIDDGAKVILCSHLGKPKNGPEAKFSLAPVAKRLSEKLGKEVVFAADDEVVGANAKAAVAAMNDGDVVLLENTRFRAEETKNGEAFSKDLASLCDIYVNDAFGSAHRAHSSTVGVTEFVDECAVGYLMGKELQYLGNAVENPARPFVTILGGAKVADKLNVIDNLLNKADTLIIGGGMAYTFIKAKGYEVGISICDDTKIEYCREMLKKAADKGVRILLPIDTVIGPGFPDPIDAPIEKSPPTWKALISAPSAQRILLSKLSTQRLSSGMAPWAYLRIPFSTKALLLLRKHLRRQTRLQSSAAAIPLQRSILSASAIK